MPTARRSTRLAALPKRSEGGRDGKPAPPSGTAVDEAELTRLEAADAFEELVKMNKGKQNVNRRQVCQSAVVIDLLGGFLQGLVNTL